MKITYNSNFYLTKAEKEILTQAAELLDKIGETTDRVHSVSWTVYSDEEIWDAEAVIEDLLENAKDEDE